MTFLDPPVLPLSPREPKPRLRRDLVLALSLLPLALSLPPAIAQRGVGSAALQTVLVVLVTAVWVGVVGGRGREERPVATLVATGLLSGGWTFAVAVVAAVSSAGLVALVALPFLLSAMLAVGALWGLAAGGLALGLQRLRGVRS